MLVLQICTLTQIVKDMTKNFLGITIKIMEYVNNNRRYFFALNKEFIVLTTMCAIHLALTTLGIFLLSFHMTMTIFADA